MSIYRLFLTLVEKHGSHVLLFIRYKEVNRSKMKLTLSLSNLGFEGLAHGEFKLQVLLEVLGNVSPGIIDLIVKKLIPERINGNTLVRVHPVLVLGLLLFVRLLRSGRHKLLF